MECSSAPVVLKGRPPHRARTSYPSYGSALLLPSHTRSSGTLQMSDNSNKRNHKRSRSEHRTSSRHKLSAPPEVEILQDQPGLPAKVRLGNLSRGGCYVLTDCDLPLGTEVTVRLKKGGEEIKAGARVVRIAPQEGLGFAFTSMGGEEFYLLDHWISTFVSTLWVEETRRSSQHVAMQIEVRVSAYNTDGERFTENTHTVDISALGGSVILSTPVEKEHRLVLLNLQTKVTVECMVVKTELRAAKWRVGFAFVVPNQPFWPISFPQPNWSSRHPDAKGFGSGR